MNAILRRISGALTVVVVVTATYLLWLRPTQLRWGATDVEVARAMPGDALSHDPTFLSTRAITINSTPEAIWPWLVQMGYGRAGFYGYDILENIGSLRGMRSVDHVVAELQHPAVGAPLPLSAAGGLVFQAVEANRYLVWSGASGAYPGAFTWALYPVDANHTRLVSRIQWSHHWTQPMMLIMDLFTEFTDHMAVRKILQGVKDRVEGRVEPFWRQTLEFASLLWALLSYLYATGSMLRAPLTRRRWLVSLGAGAAWLLVWYSSIALGVAIGVNIFVLLCIRWSRNENGKHAAAQRESAPVPS